MPNLNEKTEFICGRNPLAENNRPSFAKAEQTAAALWLKDGAVDEKKSGAAAYDGTVTDSGCVLNYLLDSDTPELNAIVVEGGVSVIQNAQIRLSGPGCSDFTCKGAAVLAESGAKVDLRGSEIVTNGATRSATIATTGATLKVFHSKLATYGGPLPEGYVPVIGPGMMEPPAPLGLGGNCRTHLSMDNSESYFYDCDIYAEAWAALSTDSSGGYVPARICRSSCCPCGNTFAAVPSKVSLQPRTSAFLIRPRISKYLPLRPHGQLSVPRILPQSSVSSRCPG